MKTQFAPPPRWQRELSGRSSSKLAIAACALLWIAASGIASAHPTGGGGHAAAGGGGHSSGASAHGGGGEHFSGGARFSGSAEGYRASPRFSYGSRGGFVSRAPAYRGAAAPGRSSTFTGRAGVETHAPIGYGSFSSGRAYGGAVGPGRFHYRAWNGGYWRGRYWPAVYYGSDFAWFLPVLPAYSVAYWWGGMPYYYYNDAYYTWDAGDGGYVASEPPPVSDDLGAAGPDGSVAPSNDAPASDGAYGAPAYGAQAPYGPPPGAGAPDLNAPPAAAGEAQQGAPIPDMSSNLYAYPKNGQSSEQQSEDRRACAEWAASQAPETANGSSIDYKRALSACLTGRGYSVD